MFLCANTISLFLNWFKQTLQKWRRHSGGNTWPKSHVITTLSWSSGRCEAVLLVVQASAGCITSYECLLGLGMCRSKVAKAARRCSVLRNAEGKPLWFNSSQQRKKSCMPLHTAKLFRLTCHHQGYFVLKPLSVRASAARLVMRAMGWNVPYWNLKPEAIFLYSWCCK